MNALATLVAEAHHARVKIAVDGDDLLLTAPAQPPEAIVDKLALHKAELVMLLRPRRADDRAPGDWQTYFDERAGIIEYDGCFSRAAAETRAFDCCVAEWLRHDLVQGPSDRCLECGAAEHRDDTLLVFGADTAGRGWLHTRCWPVWNTARRNAAVAALAAMGIVGPANFPDDFGKTGSQ